MQKCEALDKKIKGETICMPIMVYKDEERAKDFVAGGGLKPATLMSMNILPFLHKGQTGLGWHRGSIRGDSRHHAEYDRREVGVIKVGVNGEIML